MREIMSVENLGMVDISVEGNLLRGEAERVIEWDGNVRFVYIIVYVQMGAYGKVLGENTWTRLL